MHCPDTHGQFSLGLYDCRRPVFGFNHFSCWDTSVTQLLPFATHTCLDINNYNVAQGWQNLIAIYDPSLIGINRWSIYRNGLVSLLDPLNGPCGPAISLSGDIFIGRGYVGVGPTGIDTGFLGSIDDIKVYNRALTAPEINFLKSYVSPCCP